MDQIDQAFGSLKLGDNVSMDGFDEVLKTKLNEYLQPLQPKKTIKNSKTRYSSLKLRSKGC